MLAFNSAGRGPRNTTSGLREEELDSLGVRITAGAGRFFRWGVAAGGRPAALRAATPGQLTFSVRPERSYPAGDLMRKSGEILRERLSGIESTP